MDKIVVVGGGFGGFWSAVGARRQYRLQNVAAQITVINHDAYLTMRPRLYEAFSPQRGFRLGRCCSPWTLTWWSHRLPVLKRSSGAS